MRERCRRCGDRPWLLADGATGTNYFQMGLESGDAPEMWNFEHPERVRELHRRFYSAAHGEFSAVGDLDPAAADHWLAL